MTSEAPEVRGIISYLRLLAASPGSVPPKGLGAASCLALTEWLSRDTLTQPPGGPPTSAPLSVNGGSGYAKVGLEVRDPQPWSEGLGCSAGEGGPVRMCGVLPDAPPPSVSCPPAMAFLQPASKTVPGTRRSLPEGGKRKSPNTPPPGHGPLCLSFSSGNPSPGSKTGASVRETGLCSQGHAYFFKTCSIFDAHVRSGPAPTGGWMGGQTDKAWSGRRTNTVWLHRLEVPRAVRSTGTAIEWRGQGPRGRGPGGRGIRI